MGELVCRVGPLDIESEKARKFLVLSARRKTLEALDAARPLAEYYFCHVVWEKREARLEPNTAPCRMRQGSAQPKIPEGTNDNLFSQGKEGNTD